MRQSSLLRALIVASLSAAFSPAVPAQQLDVIRGQVVGPEGKPLEDAKVTATSLSGNVNRSSRTDKNGRYTITFPGGEGDYFVEISAIGYAARRFEVKRTADQEILVADAKLLRAAGVLETLKVTAPRDRPARNDATPDISGTERPGSNGPIAPPGPSASSSAMSRLAGCWLARSNRTRRFTTSRISSDDALTICARFSTPTPSDSRHRGSRPIP